MRRPEPIPPWLDGVPFSTRDAEALGITPSRVRSSDVARPFHGVSGVGLHLVDAADRARAFAPLLLPGQSFSHLSALALHGAPAPDDDLVHLAVDFPRTPPRGDGVSGHSLRHRPLDLVGGLPTSRAAAAWVESAAVLGVRQLVVAGDALLRGRRRAGERGAGAASVDDLREEIGALSRRPGLRRAVGALARVRTGVDSPMETLLRLALVDAGLPEPETDVAVAIPDGPTLHADLGYRAARIAIEYEGDGHRVERRVWQADIQRRELFEDEGWRVVRATAADLGGGLPALVARVGRMLATRPRAS